MFSRLHPTRKLSDIFKFLLRTTSNNTLAAPSESQTLTLARGLPLPRDDDSCATTKLTFECRGGVVNAHAFKLCSRPSASGRRIIRARLQ
jgi:hypothetical protein